MTKKSNKPTSTIVACATASGQSAISIVRMSGPKSLNIATHIWQSKNIKSVKQLKPRILNLGWLVDDGCLLYTSRCV